MARNGVVLLIARLAALLAVLAAAPSFAQEADEAVQLAFRAMEQRIRAEYEHNVRGIAQQVLSSGAPASRIEVFQGRLKHLTYNRAAMVAYCIAEAERDRPPTAPPVPWSQNLVLTTCVEEKVGALQKFQQLSAYADFFFPERIEACGERSRLPEREKVLKPYGFLMLDQPRLYDFARYNACLMTQPGG
jgi:hypothetical protein